MFVIGKRFFGIDRSQARLWFPSTVDQGQGIPMLPSGTVQYPRRWVAWSMPASSIGNTQSCVPAIGVPVAELRAGGLIAVARPLVSGEAKRQAPRQACRMRSHRSVCAVLALNRGSPTPRFPFPEQAPALAVPSDDGSRLHDHERRAPARP